MVDLSHAHLLVDLDALDLKQLEPRKRATIESDFKARQKQLKAVRANLKRARSQAEAVLMVTGQPPLTLSK